MVKQVLFFQLVSTDTEVGQYGVVGLQYPSQKRWLWWQQPLVENCSIRWWQWVVVTIGVSGGGGSRVHLYRTQVGTMPTGATSTLARQRYFFLLDEQGRTETQNLHKLCFSFSSGCRKTLPGITRWNVWRHRLDAASSTSTFRDTIPPIILYYDKMYIERSRDTVAEFQMFPYRMHKQ